MMNCKESNDLCLNLTFYIIESYNTLCVPAYLK